MEIGSKIKYIGEITKEQIQWGGHTDPRGLLKKNKVYIIENIEIHKWHTRIFLEEIKGYFNSVWFEKI